MEWIELTVEASAEAAEAVVNILLEEGAGGVLEREPGALSAYFPADGDPSARVERVRRAVANLRRYGLEPGAVRVAARSVKEEDWANAWKEYFHVQRIGRAIVVRPTWREYAPRPGECVIDLDPGMAFGTGAHPTTALCLEALEEEVLPGDVVFDIGTGSGILAIAAAKLGARAVVACDVDPVAVRVAGENVRRNEVAGQVTLVQGSWRELRPHGKARVAVANIVASVICAMAPEVTGLLEPGGRFVASGIVRECEGKVRQALAAAGMSVEQSAVRGEWVSVRATWPGRG